MKCDEKWNELSKSKILKNVKVELFSTLTAFPSVAALSAASCVNTQYKMHVVDFRRGAADRATSGNSSLTARRENVALNYETKLKLIY